MKKKSTVPESAVDQRDSVTSAQRGHLRDTSKVAGENLVTTLLERMSVIEERYAETRERLGIVEGEIRGYLKRLDSLLALREDGGKKTEREPSYQTLLDRITELADEVDTWSTGMTQRNLLMNSLTERVRALEALSSWQTPTPPPPQDAERVCSCGNSSFKLEVTTGGNNWVCTACGVIQGWEFGESNVSVTPTPGPGRYGPWVYRCWKCGEWMHAASAYGGLEGWTCPTCKTPPRDELEEAVAQGRERLSKLSGDPPGGSDE